MSCPSRRSAPGRPVSRGPSSWRSTAKACARTLGLMQSAGVTKRRGGRSAPQLPQCRAPACRSRPRSVRRNRGPCLCFPGLPATRQRRMRPPGWDHIRVMLGPGNTGQTVLREREVACAVRRRRSGLVVPPSLRARAAGSQFSPTRAADWTLWCKGVRDIVEERSYVGGSRDYHSDLIGVRLGSVAVPSLVDTAGSFHIHG